MAVKTERAEVRMSADEKKLIEIGASTDVAWERCDIHASSPHS